MSQLHIKQACNAVEVKIQRDAPNEVFLCYANISITSPCFSLTAQIFRANSRTLTAEPRANVEQNTQCTKQTHWRRFKFAPDESTIMSLLCESFHQTAGVHA